MTIRTARLRALHAIALVLLCLLALGSVLGSLGTPALADDGKPPRAVPLARALPRAYATYESLIATATAVANEQVRLYVQLTATRADNDLARSSLAMLVDPRLRGGLLRADGATDGVLEALRSEIAATAATEAQLLATGASASAPVSTWARPLAGEVSQPFGPTALGLEPPRLYRGIQYWHFHEGVDITAPAGTPILAPARGRVVFVGRMGDGAEVVVIAHDDGLVSLYAHLDAGSLAPTVKSGDLVDAGTRIGAVGLTGLTTGYHLHWAVYQNGEPIDPLTTLGPPAH